MAKVYTILDYFDDEGHYKVLEHEVIGINQKRGTILVRYNNQPNPHTLMLREVYNTKKEAYGEVLRRINNNFDSLLKLKMEYETMYQNEKV